MGGLVNGWVLLTAAALTAPAWWSALVEGTMPIQTALVRLVVAALLIGVGAALLRWLVEETSGPRAVTPEPLEDGSDRGAPPPGA